MDYKLIVSKLHNLHQDRDTKGFNAFDFVHAFGSESEALRYASLFWPDFVEVEGMIFLATTIETDDDRRRVTETFERNQQDPIKTEQAFNFVEITSLFGCSLSEGDDEVDRLLAELLSQMWAARLKGLFPMRSFKFDLVKPTLAGEEFAVRFWQKPLEEPCKD